MAELAAAEAVAEVAEEVAEQAENVAEHSRALDPNEVRLLLIGGAIGLFGGAVISGAILNRRLRLKYEQISEEEIAEMRQFYQDRLLVRQGEKPDLEKEAARIAEEQGYTAPNTGKPADEVVAEPVAEVPDAEVPEQPADGVKDEETQSVFDEADTTKDPGEGWDFENERARRSADAPYVIHVDEFGETGYTQTSFTYYADDSVLCDDSDNPVENPTSIVGDVVESDKFGHGSNDQNKVYVRNDALGVDIEISQNDGNYAETVHGLQHSEVPRSRGRVRFDDDEPDRS